jgi:hypothetical protein
MILAASQYGTAGFALASSLIGGLVVGVTSVVIARQARQAAETAWIRDTRRDIYSQFLSNAQALLIACEASVRGPRAAAGQADDPGDGPGAIERAHDDLFAVYSLVQIVANPRIVDAARVYAYRLLELKAELDSNGVLGMQYYDRVAQLVRTARHATIEEMRADLGVYGSVTPKGVVNAFAGTDLEDAWLRAMGMAEDSASEAIHVRPVPEESPSRSPGL